MIIELGRERTVFQLFLLIFSSLLVLSLFLLVEVFIQSLAHIISSQIRLLYDLSGLRGDLWSKCEVSIHEVFYSFDCFLLLTLLFLWRPPFARVDMGFERNTLVLIDFLCEQVDSVIFVLGIVIESFMSWLVVSPASSNRRFSIRVL